jgi:dienelactone hydrolase
MKKLLLFNLTLILVATVVSAQQKFRTTKTSVISYLEYLPEGYDQNSDKYPFVIFLHGNGEKGPNTTDTTLLKQYINLVTKHGPPKHVNNGTSFPFILISPQLKSNNSTWTSSYVMEVINYCKTYLRIDERRIYITGLSLGGGGTWVAAQDYPALFAAIAPVCGGYNSPSKACGIASEDLPVWAFHGDKDTVVPLSKSQTMVNAINACLPAPSPLAKLTIYAGVGHNAWDYAYKPDNSLHTPNVYQWLLSYTNNYNKGNKIPLANAGADKNIAGKTVDTLTGSGTDTDGSIVSYNWKKLSGPSATLANTASASLSLSGLTLGSYVFQLQVTDNNGNTDTDYIKVSVNPNNPPLANAGADKAMTLPTNSCTITGTGTDSDGSIAKYTWKQISGTVATVSGTTSATLNVSGLTEGSYGFQLTVTDNAGAVATDEVLVVVKASVVPMVNAGADKLIKLPTTSATITGSATDNDGSIVSYKWTKISGSTCGMFNTTSTSLKLGSLASGTYVFRLTATDNSGGVGFDDVTVSVDAPPVVNAGADKTVTLPMTSGIILNGLATDADGSIVKYLWSKYSGPNISASGSNTANYTLSTLYEGTYVFKLAVTDNLGAVGVDYVTVIVAAGTISGSSTGRLSSEILTEAEVAGSYQSGEESMFKNWSYESLNTATVSLFDRNGNKKYSGLWSNEIEKQYLQTGELIIYKIVAQNGRSDSGKILTRN